MEQIKELAFRMLGKIKVYDFEQGTPEWFDCRKGKMTASHAQAIGNVGKGLDTYIHKMMSEFYSSGEKEQFGSKDTERGNELEPIARQIYELENDVVVDQVGFMEYNKFVGASPDGLIGENGGWECKSPNDKEYLHYLLEGIEAVDTKYLWQVQMNLLISGRDWWDLSIYNPNFKKSMITFRILPDHEKFKSLEEGFAKGVELINKIKTKIENE